MAWRLSSVVEARESLAPVPKRRGLIAAACLGAGIAVSSAWSAVPAWPMLIAAGVLAGGVGVVAAVGVGGIARGRWVLGLLGVACVLGGAGWLALRTRALPVDALHLRLGSVDAPAWRLPATVRVQVIEGSLPAVEQSGLVERPRWMGESLRARARVRGVLVGGVWEPASGVLTVISPAGMRALGGGESVELTGVFTGIGPPANPGQMDPRPWAAQESRVGVLVIDGPDAAVVLGEARWWITRVGRSALDFLRASATRALDAAFAPEGDGSGSRQRAMMRAMLLGSDDPQLHLAAGDLARLGLVHVLSISGFHLAVLAVVVLWMLRLFGGSPRSHALLAAGATGLYMLVVPAEAPVLRSGLMVLVLLMGEAAGRRYDRLNTLGWAAFVLLLWRPMDLRSAGFQLSFLTTGVLLWRGEQMLDAVLGWRPFGLPGVRGRSAHLEARRDGLGDVVARLILGTAVVGVLAVSTSAPLVVLHTGMLPGWGVLLGIALTPLATAALVVGLIALPVAAVWAPAGAALGACAEWMCSVIFAAADWAGRLPGSSVWVGTAGTAAMWVWALAMTGALLLLIARRPRLWSVVLVVVAAGLLIVARPGHVLGQGVLAQVDQLALPRSSCVIVQTRAGVVLIDPGSTSRSAGRVVQRAVWAVGGVRARTAVVTSPSAERFSLLAELFGPLGVRRVLVPGDFLTLAEQRPLGAQGVLLVAAERAGVEVVGYNPREVIELDGLEITVGSGRDGVMRLRPSPAQAWTRLEKIEGGTGKVSAPGVARRAVIAEP